MNSLFCRWTLGLSVLTMLCAAPEASAQEKAPEPKKKTAPTDAELKNWVDVLDRGFYPNVDNARGKLRANAVAAVPHLLERLKSDQCAKPSKIAATLGFIGVDNVEAAKIILGSLDHKDPVIRVRLVSIFHYFRRGQPELTVPWIVKNLADKNDGVAIILARAASYHPNQSKVLVPALVPLLKRGNTPLKARVLQTLRWMTDELGEHKSKIEALWTDKSPEVRLEVAEIFNRMNGKDEDRLKLWRRVLKDANSNNQRAACQGLAALGPRAEAASADVMKLCGSQNPKVKASAISALGVISKLKKDKIALVECFVTALKDPDLKVRENAAKSLGHMGPAAKSAVPLLIKGLSNAEAYSYLPYYSAQALGSIGEKKLSVPALKGLLKSPNSSVQSRARESLKQLGVKLGSARADQFDPKLAILYESLEVKGRYSHRDAVQKMAHEGTAIVPLLLEQVKILDIAMRSLIRETLVEIGKRDEKAVVLIARELSAKFSGRRLEIIKLLKKIGANSKVALDAIAKAADDSDSQVRWIALQCLGLLGPESLPTLIKFLGHSDVYRQKASAMALTVAKGDSKELRDALKGQLKHSDDSIRRSVLQTLAGKDDRYGEVLPILIDALNDGSAENRRHVCSLIEKRGVKAKRAISKLRLMVEKETVPTVKIAALKALSHIAIKDENTGRFMSAYFLKTSDLAIKNALLSAFRVAQVPAELRWPCFKQVMPGWKKLNWRELIHCLADSAVSKGKAGDECLAMLLSFLKSQDKKVREAVVYRMALLTNRAKELIPVLETYTDDPDLWVRKWAKSSLEKMNEANK